MNLFYIENTYNGTNTVTLTSKQVGVVPSGSYATSVQYSKDGSSWSTFYLSDGSTNTVTLNANEKVYFRNNSGKWNYFNTPNFCTSFKGDHPHIIGGDARSLLNYSNDNITLSQGCFYNLFFEDTQLTDASSLSLPSTTIATDAYKCMFKGCTSLTTPPSLQSAVNLNADCFEAMFSGCSSLTTAPVLRSTNLAFNCYGYMFHNCTSLTTAPALPATTLADSCYSGMFQGCTSLTTPPVLPATTLIDYCYKQMFYGCSSLSSVVTYANDISATNCLYNWLSSVANSGTFHNLGSATYPTNSSSGIPTGWTEVGPDLTDYFYIENTYSGSNTVTLTTSQSGSQVAGTYATSVQYSKDKNSWTTLTLTAGGTNTITLESGEKVYFRNDSGKWNYFYSSSNYFSNYFRTVFTTNQTHTVGGNINTLLDYTDLSNVSLSTGCFNDLFHNDSGLTSVPSDFLLATTLAERCYYNMFSGCTSLTSAPALPATTLAPFCYCEMFEGCTSLTTPPTLPATTLAKGCYSIMFMNCTALTTPPTLPATTLAQSCYQDMFSHAGLTTPPTLPATTLAQDCYRGMLRNTPLTTSPTLPATTLIQDCYRNMFYECTSLTSTPTLPATTLTAGCYQNMFYGCVLVDSITTYANNISASNCLTNWLNNVAATGTLYNNGSATYTPNSASGIPTGWTEVGPTPSTYTITATAGANGSISPSGSVSVNAGANQTFTVTPDNGYEVDTLTVDGSTATLTNNTYTFSNVQSDHTISVTFKLPDLTDYFYIENTYSGSNTVTLTTSQSGSQVAGTYATSVQYSKDKNSWTTLTLTAGGTNTITLESGEKVYFRNDSGKWNYFYSSSNYFSNYFRTVFTTNQTHTVGGNINTLLDYTDLSNVSLSTGCFNDLFHNDSGLTSVPSDFLLATTLAERCYYNMFSGCTSLTSAPALPATTLAPFCYCEMFEGCTSLTTPPTLPATTLAKGCYSIMFMNCTALTTPPTLPATTLAQSCYQDMFSHAGLTTPPTLPATTLAQDCYRGMLRNTPLTTSPTLPATTLIQDCYRNMFYECTSLTSTPTLPATTLTAGCYQNMFYGCVLVDSITTYANNISASNCLTNWLNNVAATGTLYNNGSATYTPNSASGIPTGWTEVGPTPSTYTITATAGANGSISPSGSVSVNAGANQTFTVTPDNGYEVDTLTVDGSTVTPTNNTYTFTNVQANHTIEVTFKLRTFTISAISQGHTTVNPSGVVSVNYGADQTFTFSPEIGYELDKLYIDGVETAFSGSSYTFTNVQADHTLEITSKLRSFTIEASSSEGGSISPMGNITVEYGSDKTFILEANAGHLLWELTVDGVDRKSEVVDDSFTFENVTADHTIHPVWDDIYLIVTATSGPNGSITPTGDVEVIYNGNQIFNLTPNEGYEIDTLLLDGTDVTDEIEDFNFILRNIVENHTLEVTFKEKVIPTTNGFNFDSFKNRDYVVQYKK